MNKIVVTSNLKGLSEADFSTKTKGIAQSHIDKPTYVPDLNPVASTVMTKLTGMDGLFATRTALNLQMVENTKNILAIRKEVNDTIVDDWCKQTQKACGTDTAKILALGYGIRGEEGGPVPSTESVTNSYAVVSSIDLNMPLFHTIYFTNSMSEESTLPSDALRLDIYETFVEANATDPKKMSFLGSAKNGKFVNHFEIADLGKDVWYVGIYVPRDSNVTVAIPVPKKAKVV